MTFKGISKSNSFLSKPDLIYQKLALVDQELNPFYKLGKNWLRSIEFRCVERPSDRG